MARLPAALIAVAALLALPSGASAQRAATPDLVYDDRGDPLLIANPIFEGKGRVSWRECRPGRRCVSLPGHPRRLEPGRTPAGTRFVLVVDHRGRRTTARSRLWLGRVRAAAPPRLEGTAAVGSRIRALSPPWAGGWKEKGIEDLRLEACRTPSGTVCETLSAPLVFSRRGDDGSVAIHPFYAGWYVQAVAARLGSDTVFRKRGYGNAMSVPPLKRLGGVAVSAPVLVAGTPVEVPQITLRSRAVIVDGQIDLGEVACPRCSVMVHASAGGKGAGNAVSASGTAPLRLGPRARLGRGPIEVTVRFERHKIAEGVVQPPA